MAIERKSKFSLIELLMIIMLVGIVATLYLPLRQDTINREKIKEAIKNIQIIARANVAFKNDPANGYYAFDLSMLNIEDKLEKTDGKFLFDYSLTDSTVVAKTNENFGTEGATIYYYLPNGPWNVGNDETSEAILDANWLP
ncbi:MAG: type II secretion system protein [Candidatus Cloacimonadota bacterium]|nr:type II secretion system protein [Candidatus Cloacimonadota bacterium]